MITKFHGGSLFIAAAIAIFAGRDSHANKLVQNDKKELLCHGWHQFAIKFHDKQSPQPVDSSLAQTCVFRSDGSYREETYQHQFITSGSWIFNPDESKIGITTDNVNGTSYPDQDKITPVPNILIIKLTKDTLIYGDEAYYGPEQIYGHDDLYFVRVN